jgi:SAM-dependent methyltransferase
MPYGPTRFYKLIPRLAWQCDEQVSRVLARHPEARTIVDLGAGGRKITPGTICLDFVAMEGTNVLGDVQRLPFRDDSVDLIYATGLFEHVVDERAVIAEMRRVLKAGGIAHVEVPFLEQYHKDPIDMRRLTVEGLEVLMTQRGFLTLSAGAHIGPTVTLLNTFARYCALVFDGRTLPAKVLSYGVWVLLSTLLWPFKFLDALMIKKRQAHTLAMGVFYTGRKPLG